MQTYYMLSLSYYFAFMMQGGFLLLFTYKIFNDTIVGVFIYSISICLPAAILLTIYMKWLDRQQYALNNLRVRARKDIIR